MHRSRIREEKVTNILEELIIKGERSRKKIRQALAIRSRGVNKIKEEADEELTKI